MISPLIFYNFSPNNIKNVFIVSRLYVDFQIQKLIIHIVDNWLFFFVSGI